AADGVREWSLPTGKPLRRVAPPLREERSNPGYPNVFAVLSADGRMAAWRISSGSVLVAASVVTGEELASLPSMSYGTGMTAAFDPAGSCLATVTVSYTGKERRAQVRVWDLAAGREVGRLRTESADYEMSVALSPEARQAAILYRDRTAATYQMEIRAV